jgi:regulator of RNase E activity RraA
VASWVAIGLPGVVPPPIPVPELLDGFATLDSCAVSDALDVLGLPAGLGVIRPMWGRPFVVGFAVTVQVEPYEPGPAGPAAQQRRAGCRLRHHR